MDNEKRILLAILLSIVILYVYQAYFVPPPQKAAQKPAVEQQKEKLPEVISSQQEVKNIQLKPLPQLAAKESAEKEKQVVVTTGLFTATFSSIFAGPGSFKLHHYRDSIDPPAVIHLIKKMFSSGGTPVTSEKKDRAFKELIHLKESQPLPLKAFFVNADSTISSHAGWQADKEKLNLDSANKEDTLSFSATDQQGLTLEKKFIFTGNDYKIDFTFAVRNTASTAYTGNAVVEWTAPVPPQEGGSFFGGGTGPVSEFAYFINGKVEKKALGSIKEAMTIEGDILWTSIEEKYFTSAILFKDQKPGQVRIGKAGENLEAYQLLFPTVSLKPGEEKLYSFSLYLGPKDINILQQQGAHLEKSVVFGWFDIIAKPLLLALKFFYSYFDNYGLAIILITIIIKILFWPLTHKSFESMKGMQKIQPEIAQLKEKYLSLIHI